MFSAVTVKDLKVQVGNWCKLLRKESGLSQMQLAEKLAVSRLTVVKLEKGENVTIDTLFKALQYFQELESLQVFINKRKERFEYESMY
ncbi:MAG: XRE family transcriptional regulator [Flavobacteriales bacterium]|nr:XRE family transcriptional regulator [Flavobacteriales bacterium]NCA21516.1 XRE family transcriptional regulator [Crocinitomicaceae bacterium]